MAVPIKIKIEGLEEWRKTLKNLTPEKTRKIVVDSLLECAHLVQANAASVQILRGGKGPPDPKQLTSRTGTLRGSIAVNRQPLPAAIEIGTHLVYGRIHELGEGHFPKRPFLAPAAEAVADRFPEVFMKHWRKAGNV